MLVYDKLHRPGFIPHKLTSICSSCNTGFLWKQEGHTGHYILRSATGSCSNCISYSRIYYGTVRPRKEAQWITCVQSFLLLFYCSWILFPPARKIHTWKQPYFNQDIFIQYNVVIKYLFIIDILYAAWWASGKWHMPLDMEEPRHGRSIPTCLNMSVSLTDC